MTTYNQLTQRALQLFNQALAEQDSAALDDSTLSEIIGDCSDTVIDETNTTLLIALAREDETLFTREPDASECITKKGPVTACHCVYHNVYAAIHSYLEQEYAAMLDLI